MEKHSVFYQNKTLGNFLMLSHSEEQLKKQLEFVLEETRNIILHGILRNIRVYNSHKLRNEFDVVTFLLKPNEIKEK